MRVFESEPDRCMNCQSDSPMTFYTSVSVSSGGTQGATEERIVSGWICDECGHFHEAANLSQDART